MPPSYCVNERKPCVRWVEKYFKDCLCNLKDEISFSFGLTSLVFWGVAEIPQIITIFRTKKSHGVSLVFLLTWVAGDICNLTGCILEPATLPTQYYTALDSEVNLVLDTCQLFSHNKHRWLHLVGGVVWRSLEILPNRPLTFILKLYTITTIVLLLLIVYYDYISRWYKHRQKVNLDHEEEKKPLKPPKPTNKSGIPIPNGSPKAAPRQEYYYMSARSLAGSGTPPWGIYMRAAKSGPSAIESIDDSSSDDEAPPASSNNSASQAMPIPRSVAGSYGTFLAAAVNLPLKGNALRQGYIGYGGRKLLQEYEKHSTFGQWLGWLMAAIYISGRVPQIWLNIKRSSVEGLNPFMFVFALVANVTYVGSILVRTTEWESIKANMPWLLDAVICVALDIFIISQYIYYRYFRRREAKDDYKEAGKVAAS
ncbi:PQ-loop repeat-containing protein isoform X2 [Glycine max]|uniref:PQ-loop repeat-containing protein isoform X2 n=1 Tax=Glycine max TaxID=3847 RepID=UPI001B3579F0|nr:PQ-loop repeat-containing protein isoform X2 [Glycine max]